MDGTVSEQRFSEPPHGAPLDVEAAVRAVPDDATIAGMFPASITQAAEQAGVQLPAARARYRPFDFYPMREHAELVVQACNAFFPQLRPRAALRKMGRAAPGALLSSTLGKVTLGSTIGVQGALEAIVNTYPVNVRPCRTEILEASDRRFVVRFEEVYFFLDCHHVGVMEGTLRHAGVRGRVLYRQRGPFAGDMLCTWD